MSGEVEEEERRKRGEKMEVIREEGKKKYYENEAGERNMGDGIEKREEKMEMKMK